MEPILGQTVAILGPTAVAPPFLGTKGTLPAKTVPIPVTTGANRAATVLHPGSTGLTTGVGGFHRTQFRGKKRYRMHHTWVTEDASN